MKSASEESLLTVKQAAEMLGVAPNTVRAWGAAGKLPEYRHPMNNYRLYRLADIRAVLGQIEPSVTGRDMSGRQSAGEPRAAGGGEESGRRS